MPESRADEFIRLFNQVERYLADTYINGQHEKFPKLVDLAPRGDPIVRKHANLLKTFGRLRNAIVHDQGYSKDLIAEPSAKALEQFRQIAGYIQKPELVYPKFNKDTRCFTS